MSIDRTSLPQISNELKERWQPQRSDYSAGGVAYRLLSPLTQPDRAGGESGKSLEEVRIALIATHGGRRWQLPKGTVEAGETSLQTAIREVEEESGLLTEYHKFIETVEYWYWDTYNRTTPVLVHKKVDFYLLRVIGGAITDTSVEVDAAGWFTPKQALGRLTFKAERTTVHQALKLLANSS